MRAPPSRPSVLTSPGRLGDGEREAIALAMEVGAAAIILDDRAARRVAEAAGLNVIGTLGLLLEAKRKGIVTRVRPELDKAEGAFSRHSLTQRTEIAICLLPARWRLRDRPPLPKL